MKDRDKTKEQLLEELGSLRERVAALESFLIGHREPGPELRDVRDGLCQSESRFRDMLENVNLVAVILDTSGKVVFCNDFLLHLTGWSREEVIGKDWFDRFIPLDIRERLRRIFLRTVRTGSFPKHYENEIVTRDGGRRLIAWNNTVLGDAQGRVIGGTSIGEDITERRKAIAALRRERDQAQQYLDIAGVLLVALDARGRVALINRKGCEILGYSESEIVGKNWFDLCLPASARAEALDAFKSILEGDFEGYERTESFVRARTGEEKLIAFHNAAIRDESGSVTGMLSSGEDVTERRQAEEERRLTLEMLRLIHATTTDRALMKGLAFLLCDWLKCDAVGVRVRDGSDYPYFESMGFSEEFVQAENRLCVLNEDGEPLRDEKGCRVLSCMCGAVLSGQTSPFLPFFTENGSFWTNGTSDLVLSSGGVEQFALRGRCNSEGFESVALIPLRMGGEVFGLIQINFRQRNRFSSHTLSLLERLADHVAMSLAQRRAEAERMILVSAIEQAGESFMLADRDHIIQYVNSAFERLSGYSRHEVIGRNADCLRSGKHDDAFYTALWKTVMEGRVWMGRIVNRRKDGSLLESQTTVSPIQGMSREINHYVIIKRDISQIASLERQLRQAQKMEAIGTLAGGIAHDFNNILAPIIGYSELALQDVSAENPLRRSFEQVLNAGHRAKDLVRQILTFSRQTEQQHRPVRISLIVKEALKLLRASLPSTIEIRVDLKPDAQASTVLADPTQIHQVIMNLCTNAGHAMRERGGVLEIGLSNAYFEKELSSRYLDLEPGPYLLMTVKDTGHGMDRNVMQRIFDPYFTTKSSGEGTGLGLSVVYGIVKGCGGGVTVYSEPAVGSAFHVYLPCVETRAGSEEESSAPMPTGSGRVLFVDDEEVITEMGRRMLERLGYEATVASGSAEALKIFREDPSRFDLILTDQTMPQMTGTDLAREILSIRPDLPIILCTGFSELVNEEVIESIGIRGFMLKPMVMRQMAESIRRLLHNQ